MYEIAVERVFHASHALKLADGTMEPVHAHDWKVVARATAPKLDAMETVMDFHTLEQLLREATAGWEDACLNELETFAGINTSAERVAEHIYQSIADHLPQGVHLAHVTVTEAEGCRASYRMSP